MTKESGISMEDYQDLAHRTEKMPQVNERGMVEITVEQYRLIHAMLGIASEAGEIADAIKKHVIYAKPLDTDNLAEELGDLMWYIAIPPNTIARSLGTVADQNIGKLKKRYPEKYTDELATARLDKVESGETVKSGIQT